MASTLRRSTGDDDWEPPTVDTSKPHIARVYDYWLGGKNHFAADRAAGDEAVRAYPDMAESCRENRGFLRRAVELLATDGIRQFLDVGTGLPSASNTHEVAQAVAPSSRIVYVDNDPIVLAHARALLSSHPDGATGYLDADARDTDTILERAAGLLDFSQPIAVMLISVLQLIPDEDDPYQLVANLMKAVPAGSYLVITHVASDLQQRSPGVNAAAAALSQLMPHRVTPRSQEQIAGFFSGLTLLEPGVVPAQDWRPEGDPAGRRSAMRGGVALKP
jgi:hypothetical protein